MLHDLFSSDTVQEALKIIETQFPLAIWETIYVTVLATAFAILLGFRWAFCWLLAKKTAYIRFLPFSCAHSTPLSICCAPFLF